MMTTPLKFHMEPEHLDFQNESPVPGLQSSGLSHFELRPQQLSDHLEPSQ